MCSLFKDERERGDSDAERKMLCAECQKKTFSTFPFTSFTKIEKRFNMMTKKLTSLVLALVMSLSLCVPAFATENTQNRMRDHTYMSSPPFGTSDSAYEYVSTDYGNLKVEGALCNILSTVLEAVLVDGLSKFFGSKYQEVASIVGSVVLSNCSLQLQTLAVANAPDSDMVGYVMKTYRYPDPAPTEQYYKYEITYYPTEVHSGEPLPAEGTDPVIVYEYNYFT